MRTLVYFASGRNREEYQNLDFDIIYLIDNCFRNRNRTQNNLLSKGKTICIGMDCLQSIELLKKLNVKIDCFVCLNEGLYEGGGSYAINSDMFLGYAMPLFNEQYIHIMDKKFYKRMYNVSMDLPYNITEIKEDNSRYLNPFIFTEYKFLVSHAKVFIMNKYATKPILININPYIKIQIIHDSIWNYYKELDLLVISFSNQGQEDFFLKKPRVLNIDGISINEVFDYCEKNKVKKIGFTPFGRGSYKGFLKMLEEFKRDYPKEIVLYHLNKNDYKEIKEYAVNI